MVELLPCSKCRQVPRRSELFAYAGSIQHAYICEPCGRTGGAYTENADAAAQWWNRHYGSPLTLAERPQDVPACDEPSVGDGVQVVAGTPAWRRENREAYAAMWAELHAPTATCDGKRWRGCGDALARWSVMSCSGGG